MKPKYRIIRCSNLEKIWFEVEKHHWYGWRVEKVTDYIGAFPFPFSLVFKFKTYEKAKDYLISKQPKEYIKEQPVKRHIYEIF